ncbi:unnamed protein product [Clonostachys rhizophaga]|uniref:Major facilitator superfamily (MFS) profile domain-containing protein n=1 Tax=Clonostachys rhizophaga TaxID=160324 RepID=A0A9N9VDQ0_9HYPO|nr:unnamed protein product [Clonostachys rhizophaga]
MSSIEEKKMPVAGEDIIHPVTSNQVAGGDDNVKQAQSKEVDQAAQFLCVCRAIPSNDTRAGKGYLAVHGLFAAVDKVQHATGALYGFKEDSNLHGQDYSWLGSILSPGMLVGIWPSTYLIDRLPAGKYLSACSMCWSLMTLCIAACHNWAGLMVLRFLMGIFEAIINPGTTLLISVFWKKSEQPIRNGIIMTVFSSVVNGFLSWVIGKIPADAPLARWQYLYLLTGSMNVLYSIFMIFYLPDSPINAHFLTVEERWHAVQRLAENRTGIDSSEWKWDQAWEAILDAKIWIMFFFNIATSALLSMPNGVISSASGFLASYLAAKWQGRRTFVVMLATLVHLLGTALVYALPRSSTGGQMFGLYLMYCYCASYVTAISLPQANTAGSTKKVVTYGILLLGYGAGNLIGPQTFREAQAPAYTGGTITMLSCYCTAILLMGLYLIVARLENHHKDKKYGKAHQVEKENMDALVEVYQDLSDKQEDFRYTHLTLDRVGQDDGLGST